MILTEAGLEFRMRGIFLTVDEKLLKSSLFHYLGNEWKITDRAEIFVDKITSRFFNRGMTTAVLQFSGTQPLRRERLTISVIEGANTSRQDFTSHVGTVCNRHEALEDSRTILHTSSIDREEKFSRFSFGAAGASRGS